MAGKTKRNPTLIVVGPLPPPRHGVTISTDLILRSETVRRSFEVRHLDTSDHRAAETIGRWDVRNITLALGHLGKLVPTLLCQPRGVVYLPLSQNTGGFFRDSLIIRVSALAGWRVAGHLRGSEFRTHFYDRQPRLARRWIRGSLRRATSVAVLGESLRSVFGGLVRADRIAVVPNGTPDPSRSPANGRDPKLVLYLSNIRRRKGVIEAVDAALIVTATNPDAHFVFAGDTDDPTLLDELRSRTRSAGTRIRFLPPADETEKADLLASAGVMLFPPRLPEGHPRVVLEAMAAGVPIVTTARGAIPETVRDGIDGFVLSDPDPVRLAERLALLLTDVELQERMGAAARRRYLEHYTQERADERFVAWLRSLLSGP